MYFATVVARTQLKRDRYSEIADSRTTLQLKKIDFIVQTIQRKRKSITNAVYVNIN